MPEPAQHLSPMALALRRFWTKPAARAGLAVAGVFVLVGIYAPFLVNETALAWWGSDGLGLPVLADLFNRRSYPRHHDLLFNLAALLLPLLAIAGFALRRRWSAGRRLRWSFALVFGAWIACMLPLWPGQSGWRAVWDDRPLTPCTIGAWKAAGAGGGALFAPVPHRPDATYADAVLKAPGTLNPASGSRFWLGTDSAGFDVAARMAYGARISLTIGLLATGLGMAIGLLIGAVSGYFGGMIDLVLQRLVEIMMCFPTFILVLVVVAMLGRDVFIIAAVLGLTGWAGTARLVRGEFLAQSGRDYVLACESCGLPKHRIMFRHILPNCLAPLVISATFGIAGSIGLESGLAFIGLGDPTVASWGMLLNQGRENIAYAWLIWVPGAAVFLLVSSLNLVGNGLREALDPKAA